MKKEIQEIHSKIKEASYGDAEKLHDLLDELCNVLGIMAAKIEAIEKDALKIVTPHPINIPKH